MNLNEPKKEHNWRNLEVKEANNSIFNAISHLLSAEDKIENCQSYFAVKEEIEEAENILINLTYEIIHFDYQYVKKRKDYMVWENKQLEQIAKSVELIFNQADSLFNEIELLNMKTKFFTDIRDKDLKIKFADINQKINCLLKGLESLNFSFKHTNQVVSKEFLKQIGELYKRGEL